MELMSYRPVLRRRLKDHVSMANHPTPLILLSDGLMRIIIYVALRVHPESKQTEYFRKYHCVALQSSPRIMKKRNLEKLSYEGYSCDGVPARAKKTPLLLSIDSLFTVSEEKNLSLPRSRNDALARLSADSHSPACLSL